jgi:hypothetical protein
MFNFYRTAKSATYFINALTAKRKNPMSIIKSGIILLSKVF